MESATQPALPPSGPRRWRLAYHLAVVLAVKLVLLALLWNAFIKPYRVMVDAGAMSRRIAATVSPASAVSSASSHSSTFQEITNDRLDGR
jgi:hypothetical protein